MIVVDTSVWVDHLRTGDQKLAELLGRALVLAHPFVIGEIALGTLRQRGLVMTSLGKLSRAIVATDEEVLRFIDGAGLAGSGIGYVDAHLLASAKLTRGASLWTRDRRLRAVAQSLGLAAPLA